jgi:hypothetical protein
MHNDKHTADQIIILLETILGQNYFTFQNQIYQPDKGVAMGSSISGTVAQIFLQQLEKTHIKHLIDSKHLIFYARYVDDTLTMIPHLPPTQTYNITWTQSIATLNSTQHTKPTTRSTSWTFQSLESPPLLKLDIYHKPIATDTTIKFLPNHPLEHKLAAYRFFINRMLSLPHSEL